MPSSGVLSGDLCSTGELSDCFRCTSWAPCCREINLRGAGVRDEVDGPSVEGGVDALEVLYGSGEAFELELILFHSSLDGLVWKGGNGPDVLTDKIWVGSTCV